MGKARRAGHWDAVYENRGATDVSWYQEFPGSSLAMIDALSPGTDDPVIDVGGGASTLVDQLLARGLTDLTVLDVSAVAIAEARRRLSRDAERVRWMTQDLLTWRPERTYAVWHDRAVFHFLVEGDDRDCYRDVLRAALRPGGAVVVGTFAEDGPAYCSGLPVARYRADEIIAALGDDLRLVASARDEHRTPAGGMQPFTWVALRAPD